MTRINDIWHWQGYRVFTLLIAVLAMGCTNPGFGEDSETTQLELCSGSTLSASPTGPQNPGVNVTLTATPATCGGGETAEYRFAYQRDGTTEPYVTFRDWSTIPTANWDTTGLPSGKYHQIVYVRAVGSGVPAQSAARTTYLLSDVCTSASVSSSPTGPQSPGTPVTLSATASCTGGASAEFRFTYKGQSDTSYTEIAPYSTSSSVVWNTTGLASGTYNILVYVRAAGNASGWETAAHGTYLLGGVCSSVSLAIAPPSPQPVGTVVGLTGSATCAAGTTPEYRFLYRPAGTSAYTQIQGYSTVATASWATAGLPNGPYELVVQARAVGNTSGAEAVAAAGYSLGVDARVATGSGHGCVVVNGGVKCFGRALLGGAPGQASTDRGLEIGDMGDGLPAVDVGTGQTVQAVAQGAYHTCAILGTGAVKCWGSNSSGALGQGDTLSRSAGAGLLGNSLPAVDLGTGMTATAITAGGGFTCAILNDASVKCWGSNSLGQLGLGDRSARGDAPGEMGDSLPAVNLGTGRTARAIAAGASHACAILDNDTVKCWGFNTYGALGVGDSVTRGDDPGEMGDTLPVVALGTGRIATSLSLGANLSCARLDNGAVKCWGMNFWGQLGQGDTATRGNDPGEMGDSLPAISLGTTAVSIAAGGQHACALLSNNTTKCWGYNTDGQLGVGDTNHRGDQAGEMGASLPAISLGAGRSAVKILGTYLNTCAELDNGSMKCWGASWAGMLGIGPSDTRGDQPGDMGNNLPSFDFGTGRSVQSLGAGFGYHFACAVLDNATVKCWGANSYGQLGVDRSANVGDESQDMGAQLEYVDLGTGTTVVQAAAGDTHSCALLSSGEVKCWGSNRYGTLGLDDTQRRSGRAIYMGNNLPALNLGQSALAIDVGHDHSCAILANGAIKCWGRNDAGQLGLGDTHDRGDQAGEMGSLATVDLGGRAAKSLGLGYRHSCAVLDDDSLRCWGWNLFGQLGLEDQQTRGDSPGEMGAALPTVNLGTGRSAQQVSAGVYNTCAILDTGAVKCWGVNVHGQLGQGDTQWRGWKAGEMGDALLPIDLGSGRTATDLGVGSQHVCAVLDNFSVKCWGQNAYGKLGYGDSASRGDQPGEMGNALAALNLGSNKLALDVAAGWNHNCAAFSDGTVKCWGYNGAGELGLGDTVHRGDNVAEMANFLPTVDLGTL